MSNAEENRFVIWIAFANSRVEKNVCKLLINAANFPSHQGILLAVWVCPQT